MTDPLALSLATELGAQLLRGDARVSVVESCTGGALAAAITAVPGSSKWFERGYVTYADDAKAEMVGVARELLAQYGAVSAQVACAMARGGLCAARADYCAAITGIAGPDGGTADKPVGTVHFAWASADGRAHQCESQHQHFNGARDEVRAQSVHCALRGLIALCA